MSNSLSIAPARTGTPHGGRGPRRVRRDPRESFRALARDLAAAHELIDSLALSEREAWALATASRNYPNELIAILSHELRTPLQAIFGYSELLEGGIHGALNDDQRNDVTRIQESQQRLLDLLNSLVARVRMERLAAPEN